MGQGGLQPGGEQGGPDLGCRPQLQALTPAGWVPATPPLGRGLGPLPTGPSAFTLVCSSAFFAVSCIANASRLLWPIMGFQPIAWIGLVIKDALPALHWSQGRHWKRPSPVSTSE